MSARHFAHTHFFQGKPYNAQALRDFLQFTYFRYVSEEEDPDQVYQSLVLVTEEKVDTIPSEAAQVLKLERQTRLPGCGFEKEEILLTAAASVPRHSDWVHDRHKSALVKELIGLQTEVHQLALQQEAERQAL